MSRQEFHLTLTDEDAALLAGVSEDESETAHRNVDENGDFIFRFKLDPVPDQSTFTLTEFYRGNIADLLKIVRFFSAGQPVIVDSFAFLNRPDEPIAILPESSS